jgi:hypothetical protein
LHFIVEAVVAVVRVNGAVVPVNGGRVPLSWHDAWRELYDGLL